MTLYDQVQPPQKGLKAFEEWIWVSYRDGWALLHRVQSLLHRVQNPVTQSSEPVTQNEMSEREKQTSYMNA